MYTNKTFHCIGDDCSDKNEENDSIWVPMLYGNSNNKQNWLQ